MQVSDIKRANGLLADSAMFAKDTLLIPTRPLPVGWAPLLLPPPPVAGSVSWRQAAYPVPPLLLVLQTQFTPHGSVSQKEGTN